MNADPREVKAQRWLTEQIERLKALRNAKTRDSDFKQWRQATLTIIQRIWPGEARRHARFRRIPFSPPSTQADARETREYYERGCAEALQLLNAFLEEVVERGLPEASAPSRPASLEPGVAEDDFPTLDLPDGHAPSPERGRADEVAPGAVSVRGAGESADSPARRQGPERRKGPAKTGMRRRLRDMLGLDALQKLADTNDAEETPRGAAALASEPERAAGDPPRLTAPGDDPIVEDPQPADAGAADVPPVMESRGAVSEPRPGADTETADPGEMDDVAAADAAADDDGEVPFTADEFLSASPIFKAEGKPVRRAKREPPPPPPPASVEPDPGPAPLTSSTAIAVAAIAAEVARLGVPEGHRARTRAALVNLAQLVEDGDLDWDGLRGAVAFAMEFPPIGRRLIPLLIPFLDRAA